MPQGAVKVGRGPHPPTPSPSRGEGEQVSSAPPQELGLPSPSSGLTRLVEASLVAVTDRTHETRYRSRCLDNARLGEASFSRGIGSFPPYRSTGA
jgi:hypothetical protein